MSASESSPSKAFVIGSIAHWLGKKAEESRSHEWTIYLRAANPEEDLSLIVRKVVFVLHPTLQPPTRSAQSSEPLTPKRLRRSCVSLRLASQLSKLRHSR